MSVRKLIALAAVAALLATLGCSNGSGPIVVGAVYPTGPGQGQGGLEEYRGVRLAADMVNDDGGVKGRRIRVVLERAEAAEAAPAAVGRLVDAGARVIVGSHGSTVSRPAAREAARLGVPFVETGAVGMIDAGADAGRLVFRFPPTGASLGSDAVAFMRERLIPMLRRGDDLRYAVVYVDDVYGRSVSEGALEGIRTSGARLVGTFPYTLDGFDAQRLARHIGEVRPDVLVVAAYLEDGVALRRTMVSQGVRLVASIGTSSSYCHPAFGQQLGRDAVGLFASDKPDGDVIDPSRLSPEAAEVLQRARTEYRARHDELMNAAALSGFSAAWALFHHALPRATNTDPESIASALRATRLALGALPNGSGLEFAPPGAADAGANRLATSVIWEWVRPGTRAVVWPPAFATQPILPLIPR